MLASLLVSLLFAISGDPASGFLQTTPQVITGNTLTKLSAAEVSELQKKADSGDATAQFALGKAYESGNGVPQSPDQAATWYRKAAEQGNAKAQNSLGVLYWLGDGVEKNKNQAVQWYRKAARQGDGSAMFNLGMAYYNGEGVGASGTVAYAWFLLSSEAGSASGQDAAKRSQGEYGPETFNEACLAIGEMYEQGIDLPQDFGSATAWYRRAGERGHNQAQISLANLSIASKDYSEARHSCEMAAKEKYSPAYFCLGYLHQNGFGVAQNSKQAFRWYQQGARVGNAPSMRALAQMYENGEGTKSDRPQAFVWFLMAALRGNQGAATEANRLRSVMTAKEWKDAKKKLPQNFEPKMIDTILQSATSPPTP